MSLSRATSPAQAERVLTPQANETARGAYLVNVALKHIEKELFGFHHTKVHPHRSHVASTTFLNMFNRLSKDSVRLTFEVTSQRAALVRHEQPPQHLKGFPAQLFQQLIGPSVSETTNQNHHFSVFTTQNISFKVWIIILDILGKFYRQIICKFF